MDHAVWQAFQNGDFEGLLDKLTVANASFAREVDGTTPLMAACAKGNGMVVQLLLDLQCDFLAKDLKGRRAADFAAVHGHGWIRAKILKASLPERDENGRVMHTWDTCTHPGEALHVDLNQGYLVCTACALILRENALQMNSTSDGKPLKTTTVRGADKEYNEWRSQELDLADAMSKLGVIDNEGALGRGKETSIWAKRERALSWLDQRRRLLASHADTNRTRAHSGQKPQLLRALIEYTDMGPLPCFKGKKLLGPSFSGPVLRFKGKEGPSLECLEDDEEEEDLDTESMRKVYQSKPLRWTVCKERWGTVTRQLIAQKIMEVFESICLEVQSKKNVECNQERSEAEIEYEYEYE